MKHHFIYWYEGTRDRLVNFKWFIQGDWWCTRFGQWLCERGGHAPGVEWHNPGQLSPDMHCKRCGKDLG